jgi:PIN domain nuclease of toxin-antitoxin system
LLDIHTHLWVLANPDRSRPGTHQVLAAAGNAVFVSVVSLWEIEVKRRIGKLEADIASIIARMSPASKMRWLSISPRHLHTLNDLPFRQHLDPFDHLIISQAIGDDMAPVTAAAAPSSLVPRTSLLMKFSAELENSTLTISI